MTPSPPERMDEAPITLTLVDRSSFLGRQWAFILVMGYFLVVAALAISLHWTDDQPLPTLFAFAPRWPLAAPIALFLSLAIFKRSWSVLFVTCLIAGIIAWPLMGLVIHPGSWGKTPTKTAGFRIMTWNTGGAIKGPQFLKAIETLEPDVIVLQEQSGYKMSDFPAGWHVTTPGSGLMTASRYQIRFTGGTIGYQEFGRPGHCRWDVLDTPQGLLTVFNCHMPTVRSGIEQAMLSKLRDLKEMRAVIADRDRASAAAHKWIGNPSGMVVVAGDFNMPVESKVYKQYWSQFQNAFNVAGNGYGGTKMTHWHRLRIDHILYKSPFHCINAFVGPDLGSDHLPIIADLSLDAETK